FLPVSGSPYDMTASKYGYLPGSANGVAVTEGATTTQNFTLAAAPSVNVTGTVKDSLGGWPPYAKVVIKATGAPTFTLYTDPVTGAYGQTLVSGISYTFIVSAVSAGYEAGGGNAPLTPSSPHGGATVLDWPLVADPVACNAPGYTLLTSGL